MATDSLAQTSVSAVVIGIGNTLREDDGIGVRVAEILLGHKRLNCEVVEGGTGGIGLLDWLTSHERVFVVDAVNMGKPSGTVELINEEQLPGMAGRFISGHGMGLPEVLDLRRSLGFTNRVDLIGIQPASTEHVPKLSAELEKDLDSIAELVENRIQSELTRRAEED